MTKAMHRIQRKNKFLPYLLTLPSMLLFSMFTFYPFLKTVALSFFLTDKRGNPTKWAGISNWVRVLSKETFWKIIAITLEIAGINLVFTFGLAIFFALLSSQKKKGGKLYQTMYALPMAIASSPAAAIFLFIFRQKNGVVNSLLGGANIGWTTEMPYAMWAVCIMTIWMNVGISYIFLLVGFRAVPQDLIESAYLDGAGVWARIWHVMLPMASPQIFFVLFLNIAISFRSFAQIKLLTGGGPANATKNLIYYIYEMVPGEVVVVTNYLTIQNMGLTNSYAGLVLPSLISGTAIFLMRQYFLALPKEYKEAATIDGCGEIGYLFRVAMPLAVPTFASLAIYLFVQIYNQFFWPLLVTHENAMRTIQIGIAFLVTGDVISFGQILAGAMIAILPSVLVYILGQDYIIQGMTAGGIKG